MAGQLYAAPGVTDVDADLNNKTVVVTVSQQKGATLEQLWQAAVAGEGALWSCSLGTFSYQTDKADCQ